MHKAIDLGKKWGDDIGMPISMEDEKDKVHYPDFHISDTDEARLLDMPDQGEATIKYKVVHRSHSENKRDGKTRRHCSITIEVQKIDFEDKPKKKNGDSDGGARKAFSDYFKDK
jgi:hypothetical protein